MKSAEEQIELPSYTNLVKLLLLTENSSIEWDTVQTLTKASRVFKQLYELEVAVTPIIAQMQEEGLMLSKIWFDEGVDLDRQQLQKAIDELNHYIGNQSGCFCLESVQQYLIDHNLPIASFSEDYSTYRRIDPIYMMVEKITHQQQFVTQWDSNLKKGTLSEGDFYRIKGYWTSFSSYSGRLSAKKLPLVSLPTKIHPYIFPPKGRRIVALDISNAELRSLAWLSKSEKLLHVFETGGDPHSMTGVLIKRILGGGLDVDDNTYRKLAKKFTYSTLYGASIDTLRRDLIKVFPHVTSADIAHLKSAYQETYPEVEAFLKQQEQAEELITPYGAIKPQQVFKKTQKRNYAFQASVAVLSKLLMIAGNMYYDVIHYKYDEIWLSIPEKESTEVVLSKILEAFVDQIDQIYEGYPTQSILTITEQGAM